MTQFGGFDNEDGESSQFSAGTTSPPPIGGSENDNDTYWVTPDGTVNTVPTEIWVFDEQAGQWVNQPMGGGTSCPAPMTRAALLGIRNASGLMKDCHYTITDYSRGNVGASTVLLHAIDENTLSQTVLVKTGYDNTAWEGRYDIDTNRMFELQDQRLNTVIGQTQVDNFPWGNASLTGNTIKNATLTYVSGTFIDNTVDEGANVRINSGNVRQNKFSSTSNVTITNTPFIGNTVDADANLTISNTGTTYANHFGQDSNTTLSNATIFTDNQVQTDATIVATGGNIQENEFGGGSSSNISSGDFLNNEIQSLANVTSSTSRDCDSNVFGEGCRIRISDTANIDRNRVISDADLTASGASTVNNCQLDQQSSLIISGGSLLDSGIHSDSSVTIRSGSNIENTFESSSIYNQVGTGRINQCTLQGNSSVTNGNVNLLDTTFNRAIVNLTGSTGTLYYSQVAGSVTAVNVASFAMSYSNMTANSSISVSNATRTYVYQCALSGFGRIIQSANTQLDCTYSGFRDYAYVQVTNGRLYCNYNSVSNVSYIQHASSGTNRIERCNVNSQSYARFLGTSTGCRIYYCNISSGSNIYHNGTSTNCYIYYCDLSSSSSLYTQNSVNARIYYNTASGNSQFYSINVTGTHYIYYCGAVVHGYIRFNGGTGGRFYAVHCSGQAVAQINSGTPSTNFYYSSFHAYFYAYATGLTTTRHSLHGYGRRTATVNNASTNGVPTQNF